MECPTEKNLHLNLRTPSIRRGQLHQNTPFEDNPLSIEYYGNMLIRKQYYGLIEMPASPEGKVDDNPLLRKMSRFRVEPSEGVSQDDNNQLIARSPSLAKLENPEFQTRWYFKFFLGTVHNNYVFLDNNKEPHALSVCLTDSENHGIQQYRAILWQKSGCRRICFAYIPNKTYNPREVLSYFGMDKMEKHPREIIAPEVQKELLVLEEQEGSVNFKFGVIYAKKGQASDDEMFGNIKGSDEFENFLNVLGDTINLKGWTGYRGGLDVKDNMTGVHSVYTMYEGHEVMFHVSVMLPYSRDTQQVERKRHIGNDIAVIVFVDGEPDDEELSFKPSSVRTKFTHVFAVIRYSKRTRSHYLTVFSEENVPAYGPPVPVPARFTNPQEFRSFLITKLMNGEKAAYVSPVFSNKRQRTLESLIMGLQNDQWLKPEKFGLKRAVSHAMTNREHKRTFLELGQTLKVNKIMQGSAPTSVNNVGGLLALKNTPWEPHAVLSNLNRPVICGDSLGHKLLVSCDVGIYLVSEHGARLVFDRSMTACQISVLEDYEFILVRIRKHGRIYALPLSMLEQERQVPFCRRDCSQYHLRKSKGSHLFSHSRQESPSLVLAIAVGKRLTIFKWCQNAFKKQTDFIVTETPLTLTIVHDASEKLLLCIGLRHRFDIINVKTKQVTLLKNIVTYRKPKIVSALDILDEDNPELLLTYSHSSVFVRLRDSITEIVSFFWNNAPKDIVCAFPYILGFSENSIEIRLMVNGNLVHTQSVPHMKLITAKNDIYFTSSLYTSTPTTIRRRSNPQAHHQLGQSFMKIGLSDLAGLNRMQETAETVDDIHEIMSRRNIGVSDHHYASNRSLNAINKLKDSSGSSTTGGGNKSNRKAPSSQHHTRSLSATAAFCSPVVTVRENKVDISTVNEEAFSSSSSPSSPECRKSLLSSSKHPNIPSPLVRSPPSSPPPTPPYHLTSEPAQFTVGSSSSSDKLTSSAAITNHSNFHFDTPSANPHNRTHHPDSSSETCPVQTPAIHQQLQQQNYSQHMPKATNHRDHHHQNQQTTATETKLFEQNLHQINSIITTTTKATTSTSTSATTTGHTIGHTTGHTTTNTRHDLPQYRPNRTSQTSQRSQQSQQYSPRNTPKTSPRMPVRSGQKPTPPAIAPKPKKSVVSLKSQSTSASSSLNNLSAATSRESLVIVEESSKAKLQQRLLRTSACSSNVEAVNALKAGEEERAQSLPVSPNKNVTLMPRTDMFYAPSHLLHGDGLVALSAENLNKGRPPPVPPHHHQQQYRRDRSSNQHLEQIGARHITSSSGGNKRHSASVRSLPEAVRHNHDQQPQQVTRRERSSERHQSPRVNSSTHTTNFDGAAGGVGSSASWDISLTKHKPISRHKSTMV